MATSVSEDKYYFDYLKRTDKFPQSVYHKAKHNMVRKMFACVSKSALVLDAGCGIGNITSTYCDQYCVIGIDEQFSAVQFAHKSCAGKYVQGSLYQAPFNDNSFDLILFLDAIEHFTEPVSVLKELHRILKPGGTILICTVNYANFLWVILENTWHRFFGGHCKTYRKDIHPTRYTQKLLQEHCSNFFKEMAFEKHILKMELFYMGRKL